MQVCHTPGCLCRIYNDKNRYYIRAQQFIVKRFNVLLANILPQNGGWTAHGGNNYPLRGGKVTTH